MASQHAKMASLPPKKRLRQFEKHLKPLKPAVLRQKLQFPGLHRARQSLVSAPAPVAGGAPAPSVPARAWRKRATTPARAATRPGSDTLSAFSGKRSA